MITKICKTCKEKKSISEFHKCGIVKGKMYYRADCKVCQCENTKDKRKKHYGSNREKILQDMKKHYQKPEVREKKLNYVKQYRKDNPTCRQRQHRNSLARKFNFDFVEEFDIFVEEMWNEQLGRCAICDVELVRHGKKGDGMAIDHNHDTMQIRGLLCKQCNLGISLLKDSSDVCIQAAEYLREV